MTSRHSQVAIVCIPVMSLLEPRRAMIERWLTRFRRPPAAERTRAVHRIQLATATRTAPLRELLASCPDPSFPAAADSADRTVHAGERFKCVVH